MRIRLDLCSVLVLMSVPAATLAAERNAGEAAVDGVDARVYQRCVDRAVGFLETEGQAKDGSYAKHLGPGVTSLVTAGLLRNGRTPSDPLVARSLKYLEGFVQPDGGIYQRGTLVQNYETCIAMLCFSEANRDGRYAKLLANADKYIKGEQWDERKGQDRASAYYGGAGYGRNKRPDLSNTQFLMDALRAAGDGPDDPAVQKALVFVSRCQNLESEYNTTGLAAKNPDGGFYYTAAAGGQSPAGKTENGGLRSYGSMTYAGLKSMIYAGVGPDDPRVKAAIAWIKKHYGLAENPGMGAAGLYYYYHTFAKALDAIGKEALQDDQGVSHPWRRELLEELAKRQKPDGSWVNDANRWMEGDKSLVTGYTLLALSYCRPAAAKGK